MAIALVASAFLINKTVGGGGSGGTTGSVDSTGGTLATSTYGYFPTGSVSDSKGNSYASAVSAASFWTSEIRYVNNPTVGSGHTFSLTGSFCDAQFAVWSGNDTTSPLDVVNHNNSLPAQPGTVTPSVANSLIITHIIYNSGAANTIDSGFTLIDTGDGGGTGGGGYGGAYLFPDSAAVNPTWGTSGGGNWIATIAVFKAAAAASAAIKHQLLLLGVGA